MSLDKRQMFPCPLFGMHFRNNDFTVLLSHSILTADDGEYCGTTADIHKEGEANNAFSNYTQTHRFLQLPFPYSSHSQTVSCSYHSLQLPHSESVLQLPFPAAPILTKCLAFTIPLQLPYLKSVLHLPFPYSSHTQRVSCSYYSHTAPTFRECLEVTIPHTAPTLSECLAVTFP